VGRNSGTAENLVIPTASHKSYLSHRNLRTSLKLDLWKSWKS
jgi:hypothetical protein